MNKSKKKIILFAGRLLWSKGVKEFIDCSKSKRLQGKDTQFFLVGSPDLGSTDAVSVNYLQSHKNEYFTWLKKQKTLNNLFKKSYLFLYPSTYGEGTPRVVLESFKYSVPVIAFKNSGCNSDIKLPNTTFFCAL